MIGHRNFSTGGVCCVRSRLVYAIFDNVHQLWGLALVPVLFGPETETAEACQDGQTGRLELDSKSILLNHLRKLRPFWHLQVDQLGLP